MTTLSIGQLINRLALATLHVQEAEYILSRGKAMVEEYQARLAADVAKRDAAHQAVMDRAVHDHALDKNPHPHPAVTIDPVWIGGVFIDYTKLLDRFEE